MKRLIDFSSRFRILKGGKISLVVSALLGGATLCVASPTGGQVTSGSANIVQNGTVTNINQSTQKASINWQSFSIASNETVNFNQPNSSSITLNRVIGNERSVIDGALNANGQVWLLNSNGVLFGKNASINTAGLLATTAKLSDEDFQTGNYNFKNATANSVINEGTITISDSGSLILASNEVRNNGTIEAIKGKVHLTGASNYTINLNGNSLVNLKVDKGVLDALVENSGSIIADGGEVYLTTNAVDELLRGVVNNTGILEANSLDGLTGKVELFAHGGTAKIGGTITALDGFVETSGKDFNFMGADIKAGEWLIDPVNITIDSTLASSIQTALGSGDVTISTDGGNTPNTSAGESAGVGNIYLNSAISWTSNKNLTLQASNGVSGNATINIGHTEASFTINQSGNSTFSGTISGNGSFNKLGSGILTLSGANTYLGATVVDAGTLAITNNTGLGAALDTYGGGTFVNSGATLDLRNVAVGEETIILNGGTLATTTGNSSLDGDVLLDYDTSTFSVANGATLTINGKIRDSMKLIQELYSGYYDDKLSRDFGTQASLSLTSEIAYGTSTQYVSARWLGYFTPKESGQYTFYASSDDASLVYLGTEGQDLLDLLQRNDGISGYTTSRLLINNSGVSRETNTGTYTVNAGEVYPIIIYYGNNTAGGSIDFKYRAPSMGATYTFDLSNEFSISPQANPTAQDITKVGSGTLIFTANNTYAGATNINEGTLIIANDTPSEATSGYHGAGQLVIAPTSNSFTNTFDTSTAGFTFGSTLGGLTIGKSTNTADIAINSAISIAGDITLYGKDIGINEKLESTGANGTITLDGSGAITDGASGYLLASNLLLSDGAVTLDNTNNNDVDNIAASGVDSLYFYDTDGFNIGSTIGGITGISSSGIVKLSAGADEDAGTSTGGDITITGTPTITSINSYVRLFTGSISGSTGLSSVVNAGNFRYNSDESTVNYSTITQATGTTYAIYREQPTATVTANNKTITYGDNNPIYDGIETGIVNGDESLIAYTLTGGTTSPSGYTNAGSYTIDADASALTGLGYNVTQQDNGTLTVDKKVLTVTANNDAKFVTQADNTGTFNGVSYNGFVGGETTAVLGGALDINRLNSGTDTAGIYNNVLEASGLTADNYSFNYVNGDYTIVPSDQLLVRVTNVSDTYGTNTQYALSSVEYYDGSSVVTLGGGTGSTSIDVNNLVTITDGAGGSATFTVSPQSATTSTAGKLETGSYQLGVSGAVTENSVNFSDTVTIVGAHQVNQKSITASTTGGVSKVYDGTTDMSGVSLALTTLETGDVVTVDGVGSFSSKNAGTNLDYTINNLDLSGTDAANYYLSGGNSFSGNDGTITQKDVTVSYTGVDKTYDGTTSATVTDSTNDFIIGDDVAITENAAFVDKNVGTGKSVAISSIALSGADATNYNLISATTTTTTANITRLDSVTWIGGATGDWFDPANWAGGAIPDLSNVANVVIPTGTVVTFDTSGAVGLADTSSAVNIDSLGTLGSLTMTDGTLNISNDMTLDTFTQNGGTLTAGNITLDTFAQTAGTTSTTGNFTVNDEFSQGTSGSISVGGDTSITDTTGGVIIGNLNTTGTTSITSSDGDITQAIGTTIVSGGIATLDAGTNDITLNNANNDFQSTVDATGRNIAITDVNDLEIVLHASGDSTLNAGGNLIVSGTTNDLTTTTTNGGTTTFGDTTVNGNLDVTSDGNITQTDKMVVVGAATLDAGTNDITLNNPNNDFQSTVNASGNDITLADANGIELGNITATGILDVNAIDNITQAIGTTIVSGGTTDLDSGVNDITLNNANNDFQSTVDATGKNIAITDVNDLEAVLNASGNSDLTAGGDLVVSGTTHDLTTTTTNGGTTTLGGTTVNGNLDVTSDGDITQTDKMVVVGSATLNAGTNDITLNNSNNDFQSTISARGKSIRIIKGNETKVEQVITPIANNIVIPLSPKIEIKPIIEPTITKPVVLVQNETEVTVISQPIQRQNTRMVSMNELRNEQTPDMLSQDTDIRVPVSDGSKIELVNGGVKLPDGLDQLLFVVNEEN